MADTMKYVGQATPKVDALARLTGIAQFSDDMPLAPRTAHAMLIHSPYAHANIKSIDSSKAEAVHGVIAVLDYRRDDMKFRWFSGDRAYERLLFNQELRSRRNRGNGRCRRSLHRRRCCAVGLCRVRAIAIRDRRAGGDEA